MRALKSGHRDALKRLTKLERPASRARATATDRQAFEEATAELHPILDQLAALEIALAPHADLKTQLADARARYRELSDSFLKELKGRCSGKSDGDKQALVLDLIALDAEAGLSVAVAARRQALVGHLENLWEKYRITLADLRRARTELEAGVFNLGTTWLRMNTGRQEWDEVRIGNLGEIVAGGTPSRANASCLEVLEKVRRGLMADLLTGRVRVPVDMRE